MQNTNTTFEDRSAGLTRSEQVPSSISWRGTPFVPRQLQYEAVPGISIALFPNGMICPSVLKRALRYERTTESIHAR